MILLANCNSTSQGNYNILHWQLNIKISDNVDSTEIWLQLILLVIKGEHWMMSGSCSSIEMAGLSSVWPDKYRQMCIKVPKNDFTRKMMDFDTISKIP